MRHYTFRFIEGTSGPHHTIVAKDHADFYKQRDAFLAEKPGRKLIPNTTTYSEHGTVPVSEHGTVSDRSMPA